MKNGIKRKAVALAIGAMALGGITAGSVVTAPAAEAATGTYSYTFHPYAPWGKQCHQMRVIKYSAIGHFFGYKDYTQFAGYVPNWVCGK